MTFNQLIVRLFNLVSLVILAAGAWLVWRWLHLRDVQGYAPTELIAWGAGLLAASLLGGLAIRFLIGRPGDLHGDYERGEGRLIEAQDGARLWVETHGDEHAPALILTHGWGLDSTVWRDAKHELSKRFRVIVWDLPGLGKSKLAPDGKLEMTRLAQNLGEVMALANGPAVLVGHSIGGMIIQTWCRLHPESLGSKVAGVVLENTTHTDPIRTTLAGRVLRLIETPVIRPMLKLEILLSPIAWAMNWQSYLSGWMHIGQRIGGFGTQPCRKVLDHVSFLAARHSPAVQAMGLLAMMDWDRDGTNARELQALRLDSLTFVGCRDIATRPRAGFDLVELLRGREKRIEYVGHYGPLECPSHYNCAIQPFADEVFMKGAVWADQVAMGRPASSRDLGAEDRTWTDDSPRPGMH